MRVTAATDKKFASFLADVTKASSDLDAYVQQGLESIWEFEALPLKQACIACIARIRYALLA